MILIFKVISVQPTSRIVAVPVYCAFLAIGQNSVVDFRGEKMGQRLSVSILCHLDFLCGSSAGADIVAAIILRMKHRALACQTHKIHNIDY